MLERILTNHVVREEEGELVTRARESDFPQGKHNLLQAMLEISEFHVLAKHTIANVFKEDVRAYLDEQEIVYTPQFICKGAVGIEFTFDFHVAYRKKEIVLK